MSFRMLAADPRDPVYVSASNGIHNPVIGPAPAGPPGPRGIRGPPGPPGITTKEFEALLEKSLDQRFKRVEKRLEEMMEEIRALPGGQDHVKAMEQHYKKIIDSLQEMKK